MADAAMASLTYPQHRSRLGLETASSVEQIYSKVRGGLPFVVVDWQEEERVRSSEKAYISSPEKTRCLGSSQVHRMVSSMRFKML